MLGKTRERGTSGRLSHERFSLHTDAGVRKNNEDFCGYELSRDLSSALLVLADGMGGHSAGEVASHIATETLLNRFQQLGGFDDPGAQLREAILQANEEILRVASEDTGKEGMGTTIVAVLVQSGCLTVAHVGDSRALQFRLPSVRRLTQDHLHVIDVLGLDENVAKQHPQGNVLSQALGVRGQVEPTITGFDAASGDFIVLCSDGVSEYINEREMCEFLTQQPLQQAVVHMVQSAIQTGSKDNCSVLVLSLP